MQKRTHLNVEWEKFTEYRFLKIQVRPGLNVAGPRCWAGTQAIGMVIPLQWLLAAYFFPQAVSHGVVLAILLKTLPLRIAQLLSKWGLLTHFSAFLRASTQSLDEVLRQLPASPELRAVPSYIFPTYGVYWPGFLGGSWRRRCCPLGSQSFFLNLPD